MAVFQLGVLISTILHELGHAVAGRLAGIRIFQIEIGSGQIVYEFFTGGLHWRLRTLPFGGCVYGASRTAEFFRPSNFLFVLGGPLVNAGLLLIAVTLLPLDRAFDSTPFEGVSPFLFLALGNAVLLLYSLWPRTLHSARGEVANDAVLLWKILRLKEKQIDERLSWRYWLEAEECLRKKDVAGAEAWIAKGLREHPKDALLKISAAGILYRQKKYQEAARSFALLARRYKEHKNIDGFVLNNVACCCLLMAKSELLPRADASSRLALKSAPWIPAYKGTRGSVLIELGKYDEGLKLLHEAMKIHPEKSGQALNACYIGIAEARRGNQAESRNYFQLARRLDPECILLSREQMEKQEHSYGKESHKA